MMAINNDTVKKVTEVFAVMVSRVLTVPGGHSSDSGDRAVAAATLTQVYFQLERQRQEDFTPP